MNQGDKIIWDSGFGYDIGEFVKNSLAHENHSIIVLRSGISANKQLLVSSKEIIEYTDEHATELSKRYSCTLKIFKKEADGGSI